MVTHDEARNAAQRLVNAAINNGGERPLFHIPALRTDDDLMIMEYIEQQRGRDEARAAGVSALQAAAEARASLEGQ